MAIKGKRRKSVKERITLPPTGWDMGATGPANRLGLVVEDRGETDPATGKKINPNGVKGARRVDMLHVWHRKGTITPAGFDAAEKLRNACEDTERSPSGQMSERVQSSPKPDAHIAIQTDRASKFHAIYRHVIKGDQKIIDGCVLSKGTPATCGWKNARYNEGLVHLREALDRLAEALDRDPRKG